MDKFKLETSFQFPFFKLNEIVSYSEVKKPSGIAYMLLVLINESNDKNVLLSQLLENFGVPHSLHYIYSDTIANLISQGILTTRYGCYYDRNMFSTIRIGDLTFTTKGKKIFAEESLPTGVTKEAKIPVYYDIAMKQLAFAIPLSFEPKPLMDSAITEDFMANFSCDKSVEDFLNKNKGARIPIYENGKVVKNELIKKEEIITKVEEISKENWTGKYDCTIVLEGNTISFEFEEKAVQSFFDMNYTGEMVNKAIGYKNKFKFKSAHADGLDLSTFANKDIASIIVPKQIDDVLKQKGQMLITKGNYKGSNFYTVESISGLQKYDPSCEFIVVDQADNKFAFIPGVFNFNNKDLGTISIPLVLRLKVSSEQLKEVLESYVNKLNEYSEDNFKTLVRITNVSKDYVKAVEIMSGYLNRDYESNIVLLNEMKPTAMMNANIMAKYKEMLQDNYIAYLKTVTEDNLETVLKITNTIPKFLNIPLKDVISRLFDSLKEIKNKQDVYETLVEKGFDKSIVVLYVNPVDNALRTKMATDKSLLDLINYDTCISKMKELTGIKDYRKYVFEEEAVNRTEFKKTFNTAKGLQKAVDFFRTQNQELFKDFDGFMTLFGRINDDFNILDVALANPNSIKQELVEKKITSGDYQFVFVNLSAKLEIILKNKYKLNGKLSDMLSEARRSGSIERNIATDLHDFRVNRNAYIHPADRSTNFKADDLRRWCKEIFELGEENK